MQKLNIINANGCTKQMQKKCRREKHEEVVNENESKKVPEVILAPLTGKAVPLSEVPDPVFSDKVLGDGVAIIPADVRSSNVICNGKNAPVVSDHYGVMITV